MFKIIFLDISIEFASGSGMESKYLKFLHLGLQANIFKSVDDHTTTVQLPSTFQMGESTFFSLYVRFSFYICGITFNCLL